MLLNSGIEQIASQTYLLLQQAAVWGLYFAWIERARPIQPGIPILKREWMTELCYPFINIIVTALFSLHLFSWLRDAALARIVIEHPFAAQIQSLPFLAQLIIALILIDLIVYVEHRVEHRFLWPFHAIHHSAREVTWLTASRVHPVNDFNIQLFNFVLLYFLGFGGEALGAAAGIGAVVAMVVHANIDFGFKKPWCYFFISPHFHRWHHAVDAEARDKNFCLLFPFIDLAFGTYFLPEDGRLPSAYGIYEAPGSTQKPVPCDFWGQLIYPFTRR